MLFIDMGDDVRVVQSSIISCIFGYEVSMERDGRPCIALDGTSSNKFIVFDTKPSDIEETPVEICGPGE